MITRLAPAPLIAGIVLLSALPGAVGQDRAGSVAQFKARTDLLVVDALVVGKNDRPVRGLTAADFTVLEDGVPQVIEAFAEVDAPGAMAEATTAWLRATPRDVQTNQLADDRVFILFLDDSGRVMPFGVQMAKKIGHAIVDQLGPRDLAAVVFLAQEKASQEFTPDRARLRAAVDKYDPNCCLTGIRPSEALRELARALSTVPDRRKVIFYVGAGMAFDLKVLAAAQAITASTQSITGPTAAAPAMQTLAEEGQQRALNDLLDLFGIAQRANVNIYAIDPSGLTAPTIGANGMPSGADEQGRLARDWMQVVARNTGGRAILNTNAPAADVPRLFQENASYYLFGYRPVRRPAGQYRRLTVRVNRPGVEVRSRSGYREASAEAAPTQSPLAATMTALVPNGGLPLTLTATPFAGETGTPSVALTLGLEMAPRASTGAENVELQYMMFDDGGKAQVSDRRTVQLVPSSSPGEVYRCEVLTTVDLRPGNYDLRVSAHAIDRNLSGSLFADVTVPDFTREPISLSGVVIDQTPPPLAVRPDALKAPWSVVPTTERAFSEEASIAATLRIYQGGKGPTSPVTLHVVVLNMQHATVFDQTDRLDPARFAAGQGVPYRLPLPLRGLAHGEYMLRIDASLDPKHTARREVRFSVR
jgi:VWFA-related protein